MTIDFLISIIYFLIIYLSILLFNIPLDYIVLTCPFMSKIKCFE